MTQNNPIKDKQAKLMAIGLTVVLFGLIWLYTREFPVFTNIIGARTLVLGAMLVGALVGAGILYVFQDRLMPWEHHLPEVGSAVVLCIVFAPLFASLLNRASNTIEYQSFQFVSEQPFLSSNYGLLKGEKAKPSGIRLIVRENDHQYLFQYKSQEYYPLTKPGETIMLPMRQGLLGFDILNLK